MASDFIYDPLETDRDRLQQAAFDYIQTRWPDWEPSESNLEAWLIAACTRIVAEARDVAADVPRAIFRYLGATVFGVPPIDPHTAITRSTWTLESNPAGRTIQDGHFVTIFDDEGEPVQFQVDGSVDIPAGTLVTAPGEILLRSIDEGPLLNGLGGAGVVAVDTESAAWVTQIVLTSVTEGGSDGEDDDEYLSRLSRRLTLMAPRPILARDFALLAADIAAQNGVNARALAIDNYKADTDETGVERCVTVVMVDVDTGNDVLPDIRTIVDNELQAMREANFLVYVINPTRTPVDVSAQFTVLPDFDGPSVETSVADALDNYFQSVSWGSPINVEGYDWVNQDTVRRLEVATVINNVAGVDYLIPTALTIGINGGAQTTAEEFALPGAAPLTTPGTFAVVAV